MRAIAADLNADVVSIYDQSKTTIAGRAAQKTLDSKLVIGPPLNKFIDVQTDFGVAPAANGLAMTPNGRIFAVGPETGGVVPLLLYSFNLTTGVYAPVGRVNISTPDVAATTTTFRSIKVVDDGTTNWRVFLTTTGSVLINGGTMLVNNLALSDFVPIGFPTIPFATSNDQKAVYFLQEPGQLGAGHLQTQSAGSVLDKVANKLYVHNGVSATHQYFVFTTNLTPTWAGFAATGVAATDIISCAGHPFNNGDQVTFTALTGGTGLVVGTTYFVINSVAATSFQLSATTGGAAINFTTDISAATIGRAFGQTSALFSHKTGNLPALTGTLLLSDSEDFATPQHGPLSGFDCAFFATGTQMYLGKLSELTAGAVIWPSLATVNMLGTPNQIVAPAATNAAWSNALDRAIYSTGLVFVMKQFVNNVIDVIYGGTNNKYFEGFVNEVVELQPASSVTCMDFEDGWMVIANGSAGQRGIMAADIKSSSLFDYSWAITKVLDTPEAVLKFITTIDVLFDYTGSLEVCYRTSGFGSPTGGWVPIPFAEDLTAFAAGQQIQFKILWDTIALDTSIPAQLQDFFLGYESLTDSSEQWELSVDDSDNGNPSRTAFRLKLAYPSTVPTLHYRALDLSNVLLVNHNTVTNAALFQYSTDSGVTWNALGVIPNVVGTLVRYTFAAPPGVDIRPSLRES